MPTIDYRVIRSRIRMQHVLDLLQFQPHRRLGNELRGPCPVHRSKSKQSRSFAVNVAKNAFRCFSCGASGNQLDLWAAARQLPLYEATLDLCQRLDEEVPVAATGPEPKRADSKRPAAAKKCSKPAKPDHRVTQSQAAQKRSQLRLELPEDQRHNNNS